MKEHVRLKAMPEKKQIRKIFRVEFETTIPLVAHM